MVAEKVLRFQGRNKDLNQLAQQIGQQLESEGYKDATANSPSRERNPGPEGRYSPRHHRRGPGFHHHDIGTAQRFHVHIGIGKWLQNLAVAAVEYY